MTVASAVTLRVAGVAVEDITPPPGVRLSGFAGRPPGGNVGVRDHIRASALFLGTGTDSSSLASAALVLTLDLIGLAPRDDAGLRRAIARAIGITPNRILIACSHTHAGPATMALRATGRMEHGWTAEVFARSVKAAVRACTAAESVDEIRVGSALSEAAINRRSRKSGGALVIGENPEGLCDRDCRILSLHGAGQAPIVTLFTYAMHPVSLGRTMYVSADWVGIARERIERALDGPALFLQGCCGDINPRRGVATSQDLEAGERGAVGSGESVADAALAAVQSARSSSSRRSLAFGAATAFLPLTPVPDAAKIEAIADRGRNVLLNPRSERGARDVAQADIEWARVVRRYSKGSKARVPRTGNARVTALTIGETTLIGLPGEIFTEIGLQVAAAIPGAWAVGYANGNLGYLYPDSALDEGGYEVEVAYRLYGNRQADAGTAQALVDTAVRSLQRSQSSR